MSSNKYLSSVVPPRLPAVENGWHGNPAHSTSHGGSCECWVKSPRLGTLGMLAASEPIFICIPSVAIRLQGRRVPATLTPRYLLRGQTRRPLAFLLVLPGRASIESNVA